ncbi:hypothetical protein FA15DRAFT_328173 [Coprinopsis marcescibilis]|uniref:Uncharacterized protein n=1 Tax=Coprinopsis marcescibilis TaxID=230819 RepID=A0A5C3L118_COPMA|nr:hypothetical protein FA15DRAFT_328173 [Coprinopsis marcescibilis]
MFYSYNLAIISCLVLCVTSVFALPISVDRTSESLLARNEVDPELDLLVREFLVEWNHLEARHNPTWDEAYERSDMDVEELERRAPTGSPRRRRHCGSRASASLRRDAERLRKLKAAAAKKSGSAATGTTDTPVARSKVDDGSEVTLEQSEPKHSTAITRFKRRMHCIVKHGITRCYKKASSPISTIENAL